MNKLFSLVILFSILSCGQNIKLEDEISLPSKIEETSGLLWNGNDLITHNDSGGKNKLYIVNSNTGDVIRSVKIKGIKNIDWEDITQDDTHIYIADTGNNSGNRTDLVIHKISKNDFYNNNEVEAEQIYFKYKHQKINSVFSGKNNFDCEAITIYNDQILLLSKNWSDYKTQVYLLPTKQGNYELSPISVIDVNCLITGVDYDIESNRLIATAYNEDYESFLIEFMDVLSRSASFKKINLTPVLDYVNQIEAIAFKNSNEVFITRENNKKKVQGTKYEHKEKLFLFDISNLQ